MDKWHKVKCVFLVACYLFMNTNLVIGSHLDPNNYTIHRSSYNEIFSIEVEKVPEYNRVQKVNQRRNEEMGRLANGQQTGIKTFKIDYQNDMFVMNGKPFR